MTEVEFFTDVAQPLGFACRLLRKAYRKGARLWVTAPPDTLQALDRELWVFDEREFVPHIRISPSPETPWPVAAARTPVWLMTTLPDPQAWPPEAPQVLVNLGAAPPESLAGCARLIEIVSREPDEAARGRQRWRHYRELGLAIKHHAS